MKKIVAIDPGHGGSDPGAVGNGLTEKNLTLKISRMVRDALAEYPDLTPRLTRDADDSVALSKRTSTANAWGSACCVSIHINSAATAAAQGFESFIYTTDGAASKSASLQREIHQRVAALWTGKGRSDRGQKKANLHMVREFKGAAVLLELGFIVNTTDAALLRDEEFLQRNADAIAAGIAAHLGAERCEGDQGAALYRVKVDGNQVGAYAEVGNVLDKAQEALQSGAGTVEIERA